MSYMARLGRVARELAWLRRPAGGSLFDRLDTYTRAALVIDALPPGLSREGIAGELGRAGFTPAVIGRVLDPDARAWLDRYAPAIAAAVEREEACEREEA